MKSNDLFEYATRNKLRFSSVRGFIGVEELWDVPLTSKDNFNLDVIAKNANKALKEVEESFVTKSKTPNHEKFQKIFDVVMYVIEVKLEEETLAKKRAANKAEREELLKILAEKQRGALGELSETQLKKRIAALTEEE